MDGQLQQVVKQERTTLRHFVEVCGDRPVDGYHRGDVTGFLDTLRKLPATYGKSPKDKGRALSETLAEAAQQGSAGLTESTIKRHRSALTQFFRFAMDQGHISNATRANLVDDHRFGKADQSAREQRDAWTSEELTKLFASPVWPAAPVQATAPCREQSS